MLETLILLAVLIVGSTIDIRQRRLPDWITLPIIFLGLLLTFLQNREELVTHIFGALIGYFSLYLISVAYRRFKGQDGLGLGDAKLLAAAGAWLGPFLLAPVVFFASILALLLVLLLHLGNRPITMATAIPFGPFLSAAFFIIWCATRFWSVQI